MSKEAELKELLKDNLQWILDTTTIDGYVFVVILDNTPSDVFNRLETTLIGKYNCSTIHYSRYMLDKIRNYSGLEDINEMQNMAWFNIHRLTVNRFRTYHLNSDIVEMVNMIIEKMEA